MRNCIRTEHILAILVTGLFVLVDLAVLCFFVSAFDSEPHIVHNHYSAEHNVIVTPTISLDNLSLTTLGGTTESRADAVRELENALSTQLQTLTQPKNSP